MSLAVPARVLRKLAARWFPLRGQATFCLTESEFERRWLGFQSDAGVVGYDGLLGPFRAKIEARWVRIWDEPEDAKISQWLVRPRPSKKPASVRQSLPGGIKEKPVERGKKGADGCARCGRLLGRTTRHLCVRCTLAESARAEIGATGFKSQSLGKSQEMSQ